MLGSVLLLAYNHERYIERAIRSAAQQDADFEFEVLVGEDASTDGTRAICEAVCADYPGRVRLFVNEDPTDKIAIDGRITGRKNLVDLWRRARGRYVAILDGDDYWTDPGKLATQVGFIEANPDFSICYHRVEVEGAREDLAVQQRQAKDTVFTFADSLKGKHGATLGMVFRNSPEILRRFIATSLHNPIGDWPIECLATLEGNGLFMDRTMGVYNDHGGGTIARTRGTNAYLESRVQFLSALLGEVRLTPEQERLAREWLTRCSIAMDNQQLRERFDAALFLRQLTRFAANAPRFRFDDTGPLGLRTQLLVTLKTPAQRMRRMLGAPWSV